VPALLNAPHANAARVAAKQHADASVGPVAGRVELAGIAGACDADQPSDRLHLVAGMQITQQLVT
jgi:hypothetical protein